MQTWIDCDLRVLIDPSVIYVLFEFSKLATNFCYHLPYYDLTSLLYPIHLLFEME